MTRMMLLLYILPYSHLLSSCCVVKLLLLFVSLLLLLSVCHIAFGGQVGQLRTVGIETDLNQQ